MPANLNSITFFLTPERVTRAQFFASLSSFTLGNWYPDPGLTYPWVSGPVHPAFDPMDAGIRFDLQQLYISVVTMGGYDYVERTQRWVIVALGLGLWQDEFHSPREYYRRYLLNYEIYARRVRRLFTARKRLDRSPNEYSQQAFTSSQELNDREDYHVACKHWSSLDIRIGIKKQGVLDATMILSDYFTISPAIQLYVMQKTYLEATNVFENYARVGLVQFPAPKSVGPLSSASRDEAQCVGGLDNDEHLSEEGRRCKQILINRNRTYIFESHIKKKPLPLPVVTSEELSRFVYDEVDSDTDDDEGYDDDDDDIFDDNLDPSQVQLVEKFGFNFGPQRGRPRPEPKDRNKPVKPENNIINGNGITLAEYLDRNPMGSPANSSAWQAELLIKFGIKPKVYGSEPSTEVVAEGPNFEEYMHMHGYRYDSPELKHFFDTRIKLEGGFWQIEIDRLEALERRIRGDDEREVLAMRTHTQWDLASTGSRTPVKCNSNETADTSESGEPETFHIVAPPPGFAQMPMSMHEYGRRVANCDEPQEVMHWGETFRESKKEGVEEELKKRPANPRHNPANYFKPPILPPFKFEPATSPPFKKEQPKKPESSYSTGEYERLHEEYNQHMRAVDNLLGSDTYDKPIYADTNTLPAGKTDQQVEQNNAALGSDAYGQYNSANEHKVIDGSRNRLTDRSNDSSRKTLNLPIGQRVDITNLNPSNPPSINYTQQWLQQRATMEDDEDEDEFEMQQMNELGPYEEDSHRYKRGVKKNSRFEYQRGTHKNAQFEYQETTNEHNSYKARNTPKCSNSVPAPVTFNAQGSRMAYTPSAVNQQQHIKTGSSDEMEDRQLKLTASEDLLLSTTFKAYEVQQ